MFGLHAFCWHIVSQYLGKQESHYFKNKRDAITECSEAQIWDVLNREPHSKRVFKAVCQNPSLRCVIRLYSKELNVKPMLRVFNEEVWDWLHARMSMYYSQQVFGNLSTCSLQVYKWYQKHNLKRHFLADVIENDDVELFREIFHYTHEIIREAYSYNAVKIIHHLMKDQLIVGISCSILRHNPKVDKSVLQYLTRPELSNADIARMTPDVYQWYIGDVGPFYPFDNEKQLVKELYDNSDLLAHLMAKYKVTYLTLDYYKMNIDVCKCVYRDQPEFFERDLTDVIIYDQDVWQFAVAHGGFFQHFHETRYVSIRIGNGKLTLDELKQLPLTQELVDRLNSRDERCYCYVLKRAPHLNYDHWMRTALTKGFEILVTRLLAIRKTQIEHGCLFHIDRSELQPFIPFLDYRDTMIWYNNDPNVSLLFPESQRKRLHGYFIDW